MNDAMQLKTNNVMIVREALTLIKSELLEGVHRSKRNDDASNTAAR